MITCLYLHECKHSSISSLDHLGDNK